MLTVHVDGGTLLKNPPLEVAAMANQLQRDSKLPLLIAADLERGLSMRMNRCRPFPRRWPLAQPATSRTWKGSPPLPLPSPGL